MARKNLKSKVKKTTKKVGTKVATTGKKVGASMAKTGKKVGTAVSHGAHTAKEKTVAAFGSLTSKFRHKDEEE